MASSSTKNGTGDFADNIIVDDILKETKFPHRSMVGIRGVVFGDGCRVAFYNRLRTSDAMAQ